MAGAVLLVALTTLVGVYLSYLDRGARHSGSGVGATTAPGQPPIGCLLGYTVFLWAEAIVAFSVVYAVLRGTRVKVRAAETASS